MKLRDQINRPHVNPIFDDIRFDVLDEVSFQVRYQVVQVRYQVDSRVADFSDRVWEQINEDLSFVEH